MVNKKIDVLIQNKQLTELEGRAIDWILAVGFWHGEIGFSDITFEDLANGIEVSINTAKGIIGSLSKKGYVWTDNSAGIHVIYVTRKTYELDDNYETKWKEQLDMNPFI